MENKFLELTNFWYEYVGCDHHKDRDCHFYVNKVWSYGQEPYYRIEHYGYIEELNDDNQYKTYQEALQALTTWLYNEMKDVMTEYLDKSQDDYKDYDYNCKGVIEVCNKYRHLLDSEV